MNWSILGKLVVKALPRIIQTIEGIKGGTVSKKDAALSAVLEEFKDIKDTTGKDVLNNPKVIAAISKANSALVEVHDVIAALDAQ